MICAGKLEYGLGLMVTEVLGAAWASAGWKAGNVLVIHLHVDAGQGDVVSHSSGARTRREEADVDVLIEVVRRGRGGGCDQQDAVGDAESAAAERGENIRSWNGLVQSDDGGGGAAGQAVDELDQADGADKGA